MTGLSGEDSSKLAGIVCGGLGVEVGIAASAAGEDVGVGVNFDRSVGEVAVVNVGVDVGCVDVACMVGDAVGEGALLGVAVTTGVRVGVEGWVGAGCGAGVGCKVGVGCRLDTTA